MNTFMYLLILTTLLSEESLKFRISTGLKDIIGKELITDDHIAIFELVKNSYDAYAKNVKIIFENITTPRAKGSRIIIVDDGHGMSRDDIEKKWLFVGFSEKKSAPDQEKSRFDKTKGKRIFAGAKGIGRFSADKLGRHMTLYSKKRGNNLISQLDLDWKLFEKDQGSDFQTIPTKYVTISDIPYPITREETFPQGTVLRISSLHNAWDVAKLLKLKRYLQRLINPSGDEQNLDFKIKIIADEFEHHDRDKADYAKVNGLVHNFVFEKLGIKTTQITCKIQNNIIKTSLVDKGDLVVEYEEENKYKLLHDIAVNLFYLNSAAKTAFTRVMGVQPINYGSIFLYRNGFRVYSYGDEGNDWLGLEKRKGQGYARFLSGREMLGRIEILGTQPEFKELSSRSEGLVRTSTYDQLISFVTQTVLRPFERYVVSGLGWDTEEQDRAQIQKNSTDIVFRIIGKKQFKNIHFGKNLLSVLAERKIQQIPKIINNFEVIKNHIKSKDEQEYVEKQFRAIKNATKTLVKERQEFKQKYEMKAIEALFLNKALSSEADQIINLIHSIKTASQAIQNRLYRINKKIKTGADMTSMLEDLDSINLENQKVSRISNIVTTANFDLLSDEISADLAQYIIQYSRFNPDRQSYDMDVRVINDSVSLPTKFPPISISLVLDNLLSNADKAGAKHMTVLLEKKERKLRILVGNDGDSINDAQQQFLFTRGFSTRKNGSGLGLFYCKSLIESIGGTIGFLGNNIPDMGKGACFEVILH